MGHSYVIGFYVELQHYYEIVLYLAWQWVKDCLIPICFKGNAGYLTQLLWYGNLALIEKEAIQGEKFHNYYTSYEI